MPSLPQMMNAIAIVPNDPKGRVALHDIPVPHPAKGQLLLKVAAAGVNRADLLQVAGHHPPPPGAPGTPGLEASGTVVAAGPGLEEWLGRTVCALLPGGGYAEYALAAEACVLPVPEGVTPEDSGGLPEVYFTVWTNVMDWGRLAPGETFLIHGGSSGIGTAAIQLMHARGHRVFATAGSTEKCSVAKGLGAARAINYREEDFVAVVMEETGGKGVDVILDMVGGEYVQRNLQALAKRGRLVNIAYMQGSRVNVDLRPMQAKQLTMIATGLRNRPDDEKRGIRDALLREVWPLFKRGSLKPIVDRTFPLAQAQDAMDEMRANGPIGKILLIP